jgi:hypothetical protein
MSSAKRSAESARLLLLPATHRHSSGNYLSMEISLTWVWPAPHVSCCQREPQFHFEWRPEVFCCFSTGIYTFFSGILYVHNMLSGHHFSLMCVFLREKNRNSMDHAVAPAPLVWEFRFQRLRLTGK